MYTQNRLLSSVFQKISALNTKHLVKLTQQTKLKNTKTLRL